MRSGRKSASQTPAPLKDRIYGSKKNKEGSASSDKSAKSIILSAETLIGLKNKLKEFKEKHPNKDNITLNDLKAVYRRGLGAYSSTHRPTISGGRPNTRNAWAMARVNKFLLKAGGTKVKKAYVQDDDLIKNEDGGNVQKLAFIEKWENGAYWLISKYENDLYYPIDGAYKLYVVKDMAKRWGYKLVSKKEYEKLVSNNQYENGGLIAPNGKPSNLTPEQYKLVRTPEFKAWFGDWENDPENASKVVDENGEPLVVYRGFNKKSDKGNIFQFGENIYKHNRLANRFAHYFTRSKGVAKEYAEQGEMQDPKDIIVKEYFLKSSNIVDFTKKNTKFPSFDEWAKGKYSYLSYSPYSLIEDLKNRKIPTNSWIFESVLTKAKNDEDIDELSILKIKELQKKIKEEAKEERKIYKTAELLNLYDLVKIISGEKSTELFEEFNEDEAKSKRNIYEYFINYKPSEVIVTKDLDLFLKNLILENGFDGGLFNEFQFGVKKQSDKEVYFVFESNQIKLADGTNTTFNMSTNDIRYDKGGVFEKEIMLPELNMSYDSLKKTLNNQGYNIEPQKDIVNNKNTNMFETLGKLFRPQNINYIAQEQNVPEEYARMQLAKGVEHEFEHTNDYETAKTIALHHLAENVDYYIMLEKAENQVKDKNYDDHFKQVYAQGGSTNFAFQTPTGKPTKLTYLQQVLVRTSSFKKWFGDWEKSAKEYILTDDFKKSFSGVSKCLDMETLEPRVVFHGTRTNEEFFVFNANMKGGRPYGYFAFNEEYSENFTANSQTGMGNNPYLYKVFLSVKNPFEAVGQSFDQKVKNAEYWKTIIAGQIQWQKNRTLEKDERLTKAVESQIGRFVDEICSNGDVPFWMFMSRDRDSIFKRFLMSWGFDSVEFSENIRENFDVNNPSEFTYAFTIFDAPQVKLADGRNVEFNMVSDDMRYEEGGNLNTEDMNKYEHLKSVIGGEGYEAEPVYKSGGSVQSHGNNKKYDATKGGYFVGRPHSQGGIKAINISTNSPIEVEGGEVIITKPAVEDNKKRMFEGEMLTNREILSKINQSGGGVPIFEEGGMCGCSGKKYNFGGNVVEDFRGIYDYMVKPYIVEPISETMQYVDSLIIKRKK